MRANPATVHRTPRLTKADDEPVLFISLQVSGESTVAQDGGRHRVVPSGDGLRAAERGAHRSPDRRVVKLRYA
ncbi:hypothetical protein SAV14893_000210 [Streptomyces avermitilis]|uniref:Uncharacterized protein n=1 Tax=Streptomyces avermitilis TaxID=33903 RepID=A0A4D4LQA3_STRAX|nr:hypothetical protein [Streptomyces sp. SID5469]BBJ48586.1 hypothetical protein SAVMC3_12150 [Streptomyces avermitilis]GDY60628.1 hypothetical protein SAV14893_000210 [Streptomyces avermitilis]GDY79297.1 hypothetical protein SAV31267_087820 [Streptomyces avermitilis]GDY87873.1 hypothetical protein SAVCW2_70720 [Streptomyces avermitilis]